MWLTRRQRRALEFYRKYRYEPLTGWSLFRATLGLHVLSVILAVVALTLFGLGYEAAALMVVSLVFGIQWRDTMYQSSLLRIWPALHAVIDWDKLESLLQNQLAKDRSELDE